MYQDRKTLMLKRLKTQNLSHVWKKSSLNVKNKSHVKCEKVLKMWKVLQHQLFGITTH